MKCQRLFCSRFLVSFSLYVLVSPAFPIVQVCSDLKTVIDADATLQYHIELAVAGMEDGPSSVRSPAERLEILRTRQNAWNKLKWKSQQEVPMSEGLVWEVYGNVLAQARGDATLAFHQLPSDIRGIEGRRWVLENLGVNIRDFGMDPAQDLLILLAMRRTA